MGIYTFSLVLGALGLLLMALGGLFSGGHGGDSEAGHHEMDAGDAFWSNLVSLLSPRTLFSLLVGFGAAGLLLEPLLASLAVLPLAVVGGLCFERFLVRPVWRFIFKFEGKPAVTLEQMLMESGVAATSFDARGDGLIRLSMNGEYTQMLASLRAEDRERGVQVRAGDRLLVEEVDTRQNLCVVSWVGPAELSAG